ncbi:MAG: nuclear transport factor 2 family protein [Hyphomonadaceae bacterium]
MNLSRRMIAAGAVGVVALTACAPATQAPIAAPALTREALSAWLDRYGAAWTARDAASAGALFSEDATYHEMPFDAPFEGRAAIEAYWTRVTAPQTEIEFTYEVVATDGDTGVAHWRAAFNAGGAPIELDGVFVLTFAEDFATVRTLREWWHVRAPA